MPFTLYVYNKDSKGKKKAYGQAHLDKASAEKHLSNLKDYYGPKYKSEVFGTKIVEGKHRPRSSKQIINEFFK